jgi:hypothetical protein
LCSDSGIYISKYTVYKISFVSVRFITVTTQIQVTMATNCRALTSIIHINYVVGHEGARSLFVNVIFYSMSAVNILMWICEL